MNDLKENVARCETAVETARKALDVAIKREHEATAKYEALDATTHKTSVVDLVKAMAAETRDRRAGLIE
jgi:rubrerythrin